MVHQKDSTLAGKRTKTDANTEITQTLVSPANDIKTAWWLREM